MTISSTTTKISYTATAGVYVYGFSFKILASSEIVLYINGVSKTLDTHYSVSGVGNENGGSVSINSSYVTAGDTVLINRVVALTQTIDLVENDALPASSLENGLDKNMMAAQQLKEELNRSLKLTSTSASTPPFIKDTPTTIAGQTLQLATSGSLTFFKYIADPGPAIAADAATATAQAAIATTKAAEAAANTATVAADKATVAADKATVAADKATVVADTATVAADKATVAADKAIVIADMNTVAADKAIVAADKTTANTSAAAAQAAAASGSSYVLTTGSANAYVITPSVPLGAYVNGNHYFIKANFANTASATGNISGLGAKTIKKFAGAGIVTLSSGDIEANGSYELIYDSVADAFILLYGGSQSESAQVNINTANVFLLNVRRLSDHSAYVANTIDGFADKFQDGSTQNNTGIDLTNSTGNTHDNTNKLWKNTPGSTGLNSDQDFTTEANHETYDYPGTTATIATNTITITAGTFPANAVGMRFSPENPFNPSNSAVIATYTDSTHVVLVAGHGLTASNSAWTLRSFQIASGVAKLGTANSTTLTVDITGTSAADNNNSLYGGTNNNKQAWGQEFQVTTTPAISSIKITLKKVASPTDNFIASLFATTTPTAAGGMPTGAALATATSIAGTALTTSFVETTITFPTPYTLTANNYYIVVFTRDGGNDATNYFVTDGPATYTTGRRNNNNSWVSDGITFLKVYQGSSVNVINEYVPVIPTFANLAAVSAWSDVNSFAKTETLNSANVWYLVFKTAITAWGATTELGAHEVTTGTYRKVVINTAGTWQYNSNATYGSETLTNTTINTLAGAIRQALTLAANRMTSAVLIQSMDASLAVPTGKAGIVPILYSTVNTNNPQVDQTRINYDAVSSAISLVSRVFGGTSMPPVPASAPATLVVEIIEKRVSGSSLVYEVSRDAGTTYTAVATWDIDDTLADGTTAKLAQVTVTGQPSGTSPKVRIRQTTTGESYELHALGLNYK